LVGIFGGGSEKGERVARKSLIGAVGGDRVSFLHGPSLEGSMM